MSQQQKQSMLLSTIASKLSNLGTALLENGHDEDALAMYNRAFSTLTSTVPPMHGGECRNQEEAVRNSTEIIAWGEQKLASSVTSGAQESEELAFSNSVPSMNSRMLSQPLNLITKTSEANDSEESFIDECNLSTSVYNMGLIYARRKAYHTAEELFKMSAETAPSECNGNIVPAAYAATNNLGHIAYMLDRYEDAVIHFSESLRIIHSVAATSQERTSAMKSMIQRDHMVVLTNHALTLFALGEACERQMMMEDAMSVYTSIVDTFSRTIFNLYHNCQARMKDAQSQFIHSLVFYRIGNIHYYQGSMDQAIKAFEFARKLRADALGDDHTDLASLTYDIGILQWCDGQADEAMKSFRDCLARRQILYGSNSTEVAEVLYRIGKIHQDTDEYEDAVAVFASVLQIERNLFGRSHPDVAVTLTNLGQCFYSLNLLDRALAAYHEVLSVVRTTLGSNHPSIGEIQNTIGMIHMNMGNGVEAAKAFAEARRLEQVVASSQEHSQHQSTTLFDESTIAECAPAA